MDDEVREFAVAVLNRLMKDSSVTGMRFFTPQLLLDGPNDVNQEAFINLTSNWHVFDQHPGMFPDNLDEVAEEEAELQMHRLRGEEVEKVEIATPWPHLVVTFKSGKIPYLNGHAENFEPWTAGMTKFGNGGDDWLVVACPGGALAVWAPENWDCGSQ